MTTMLGNLMFREKKLYKDKFGEERFGKLLEKMDPETKNFYKEMIISGEKYDFNFQSGFQKALIKDIGKEESERFTEEIAKQQLKGLFGFITKIVSTDIVLNQAQKMWLKVYSEGRLSWEKKGNILLIRISDFNFDNTNLIFTKAYFKGMLEKVTGKKVARSEIKRISENESEFWYEY